MASISKASHGAFQALKAGLGFGPKDDVRDRRYSRSTDSSTVIDFGLGKTRANGWSTTLRKAASLLYVGDIEDQDASQHLWHPKTPMKRRSFGSLKRLSRSRSSYWPSSVNSRPNDWVAYHNSSQCSPLFNRENKAPILDVEIPGFSLRERTGGLTRASGPDASDVTDFASDDHAGSNGLKLRAKPVILLPQSNTEAREIVQSQHRSNSDSHDPYLSPVGYGSDVVAGACPNAPPKASNKVSLGSSYVAVDKGCNPDVEGNAEPGSTPNSPGSPGVTLTPVSHLLEKKPSKIPRIQFKGRTLDYVGNVEAEPAPDTTPNNEATQPPWRSSGRFPLRNRLKLKKSLDRFHSKISSTFSPRQKPSISRTACQNYDLDVEDLENSPLLVSMGPREEFERKRSERHTRYVDTIADSRSRKINDSWVPILELSRQEAGSPCKQTGIADSVRIGPVEANADACRDELWLDVEANERVCGEDLDNSDRLWGLKNNSLVKFVATEPPSNASLSRRKTSATSIFRQGWSMLEGLQAVESDIGVFAKDRITPVVDGEATETTAEASFASCKSSTTSIFRQGWQMLESMRAIEDSGDFAESRGIQALRRPSAGCERLPRTYWTVELPFRPRIDLERSVSLGVLGSNVAILNQDKTLPDGLLEPPAAWVECFQKYQEEDCVLTERKLTGSWEPRQLPQIAKEDVLVDAESALKDDQEASVCLDILAETLKFNSIQGFREAAKRESTTPSKHRRYSSTKCVLGKKDVKTLKRQPQQANGQNSPNSPAKLDRVNADACMRFIYRLERE